MPTLGYALIGLLAGLAVQFLMPDKRSGSIWLASLLGIDGALIGQYVTTRLLMYSGEGTTLFLALSVVFLLLTIYRTAFGRSLDASGGETCTL